MEIDSYLKTCCQPDPGFAQFVEGYGLALSAPQAYLDHIHWANEQILTAEEHQRIENEGFAKGIVKGAAKRDMGLALNAFRNLAHDTNLDDVVETLKY
ncbi:MAG: hypothetical protein LBT47_08195 [Deltaproteobacteria bacterium]|nr:hypothetical protein [Deltaproteobacteria bacterium]